jgi:hypothetical protein
MKIVLNHITRMRDSRICVAGLDSSGRHVRPVTSSSTRQLTRTLLIERGGPFEIGAILDLGDVSAAPRAPAIEDHHFLVTNTKRVKRLQSDEYFHLLDRVAKEDLQEIFGPDLKRRKQTFAVDRGAGSASLGVLRVEQKIDLTSGRYGGLRLQLGEGKTAVHLPVTDLRFVEEDHKTVRDDVVEEVRWRIGSGVQVILMVGLTRPFKVSDDDDERHWLQINGICLADRPLGSRP